MGVGMSNLSLAWQDKAVDATLSGGGWDPALPLSHLKDDRLRRVARSNGLSHENTRIVVDLGEPTVYQAVFLLSHNLSTSANIRVRCSDDSGFSKIDFDSGVIDAYPFTVPMSSRRFEDSNWWDGKPRLLDLEGYPLNSSVFLPHMITSRYIFIEIFDSRNDSGYVEAGRVLVAPFTELKTNISYGKSISWLDQSQVSESLGGATYFFKKPKRRRLSCSAKYLSEDEALADIFEMQKHLGVTRGVFIMPDRENIKHGFRESFFGRMVKLGGIDHWQVSLNQTSFEFEEIL